AGAWREESAMPATTVGSVYQRAGDGRWVAAMSLGGGRRVTRYARSEREAKAVLQALQREHHTGTLAPPTRCTLAEWVTRWLDLTAPNVRPSTLWTYETALRSIVRDLGHVRLDKLTPLLLTSTFTRLQRQGKGSRATLHTYTYLVQPQTRSSVMSYAK